MKFLVVYFSRGGKTKKVAEEIAQELECKSVDITKETPGVSDVGVLLVGSGNYGGKTSDVILTFLRSLEPSSGRKAAVFATAGGVRPGGPDPPVLSVLNEVLEMKGYKVVASFKCPGQMFLLNRGHPNKDDLNNAKSFARDLKERVGESML
jgi:flavodoxin